MGIFPASNAIHRPSLQGRMSRSVFCKVWFYLGLYATLCLLFALPSKSIAQSSIPPEDLQLQLCNRINAYRAEMGLTALTWSDSLTLIAAKHSDAMAEHRRPFSHKGFKKRAKQVYQWWQSATGVSENLYFTTWTGDLVEMAFEGWKTSQGHHENMIGAYDMTGISIVKNRKGEYFITQLFVQLP
ncbi:CAP domain-containing protein [Pontibacter sp. G13]|uniref:CAP domain-containing protein n=1 Tax=Pontibacter sp. G13 TaxID=3074898 RepID=UPI0028891CF1|nr:CAP domain-containing protein [Pontibacter sp. G13]WNJ21182.1 CAP domain-containing protein [Pontibacter sp. G13]